MPKSADSSRSEVPFKPDYAKIVRFLFTPLIEDPTSLKVDCEELGSSDKVWVRIAFEQEDKGKVFGRGGRNLKAIQTVLNTSALGADQTIYLDVYGSSRDEAEGSSSSTRGRSSFRSHGEGGARRSRSSSRKPRSRKPSPQLRSDD